MSTSSTILTVEDQLVTLLDAALSVPVTYAWPGPNTAAECVFLGVHPDVADIVLDRSSEDPVIKAGRRQSQEDYTVTITCWAFRPDVTADAARDASGSVHTTFDTVDDTLRNDHTLGLSSVQRSVITEVTRRLFPFQKGWAAELRVLLEVHARLT